MSSRSWAWPSRLIRWRKNSRFPFGPGSPSLRRRRLAAPRRGPRRPTGRRTGDARRGRGRPPFGASVAPGLELRLDEHERVASPAGDTYAGGRTIRTQMKETSQVTSSGWNGSSASSARCPLEHGDPRVVAELRVQLPVANVERDHPRAPACSRQSVKPPVDAPTSRQSRPSSSTSSRSSAFASFAAAGDEAAAVARPRGRRPRPPGPRLVVAGDEPGQDERLRLAATLREPALDEQDVEPLLSPPGLRPSRISRHESKLSSPPAKSPQAPATSKPANRSATISCGVYARDVRDEFSTAAPVSRASTSSARLLFRRRARRTRAPAR